MKDEAFGNHIIPEGFAFLSPSYISDAYRKIV